MKTSLACLLTVFRVVSAALVDSTAPPPIPTYNLLTIQSGAPKKPFAMRLLRPAIELAVEVVFARYNIRFLIPDANFVDDGPDAQCGYLDVGSVLGLTSRNFARLRVLSAETTSHVHVHQ